LKDNKINDRKEKIIQFIKDHPYCSMDSIFTKGKIPKSKATIGLVNQLVTKKKIQSTITSTTKKYYVGEMNWMKEFELTINDMEKEINKDPRYDNHLTRKIIEFFKVRVRVLKDEGKKDKNLDISDTLDVFFNWIVPYSKNPNRLFNMLLMDILNCTVEDDKYYLTHQLHSNPREKERKFHKTKTGSRRSIENLLDMKKKGNIEFGLTGQDFKRNMKKLTNDPNVWLARFYAEKNRMLYKNSPELQYKIWKRTRSRKFKKPRTPEDEETKRLFDELLDEFLKSKKPIEIFSESLSVKLLEKMEKILKESVIDFNETMKMINSSYY